MSRDHILHKVRTAIGRSAGQQPPPAPPVELRIPSVDVEQRVRMFSAALEKLGGTVYVAGSAADARAYAARLLEAKRVVASGAPILAECGLTELAGVRSGFTTALELRQACASADAGLTSADYALADTGTLVLLSSAQEARMISLLPPLHVAVVERSQLLTGLDELFSLLPDPAAATSAMVLITGPSRTADIEQILVRGVHGPRDVHVVLV